MHQPGGDKIDYIRQRVAAGREIADDDVEPEIWVISEDQLAHFWTMNQWRGSNGLGPSPFGLDDLAAYCRFYGVVLQSWEVRLLKQADLLYLSSFAEGKPGG